MMLFSPSKKMVSRLPQGRCGLKYVRIDRRPKSQKSPSARKVWIEIYAYLTMLHQLASPSARKVWIEMKSKKVLIWTEKGRLPQGRCGLKSSTPPEFSIMIPSPSARKVWIEMSSSLHSSPGPLSPSARKVWIEIVRKV